MSCQTWARTEKCEQQTYLIWLCSLDDDAIVKMEVCLLSSQVQLFASSVATLFLCRDDGALQCDAVVINDVRGKEEIKKKEEERKPVCAKKNGRVYSTKFIIGQKAKTYTQTHLCL